MSDAVIFALLFAIFGTTLRATAGAPRPDGPFKISAVFLATVALLTAASPGACCRYA